MVRGRCSERLRAQLPPVFVDRDDGVAALVCVDPQYDHVFRLLAAAGGSDRSVGISQYGAVPRSSEATPAGPSASDGPHNEPVPPDHVFRLLAAAGGSDRSVGISQYGAVPRSSEATPAGPSASDGPHNEPVPPRRANKSWSEPAGPTHPDTGDDRVRHDLGGRRRRLYCRAPGCWRSTA